MHPIIPRENDPGSPTKIYNILKCDVVVALADGCNGTEGNEVYSVIKLLEITHNTTLDNPKKICNSNGMYGCDAQARANEWIQFFIDNNLLKERHEEPVSFHHNRS